MVLHPLEFSECYLDSPWFRKSIQQYEVELEHTNTQIKQLIKDAKSMLNASRVQTKAMAVFNDTLQHFRFDCIGENLTDDEKGIAGSLNEFGLMLNEVSEQWSDTIQRSETQLIEPLEKFRKNQIHSYKDSKKLFDKSSEKYYKQLEQTLSLSHKKKEQQLHDSDNELISLKRQFHKEGLNYVYKLQEIQERKKFEFVEHLLMFMKVYFNFFKQSHETAMDCREYMQELQMRIISTRERYEGTRDKTQSLMRKMEENPHGQDTDGLELDKARWSRAGYLLMMDRNTISARLTSKWTRFFCTYNKSNKLFQIVSTFHHSGPGFNNNLLNSSTNLEPMIVRTCTRRSTDSIDKRFCFDLEVEDTGGKVLMLTFQAVSDLDRKKWMQVMDGKEPEYVQSKDFLKKEGRFKLDKTGFAFVERVIDEIERRGVDHEGIYRLVGVMSKVDLLVQQALDPDLQDSVDYRNENDWEINTLTSALKSVFRNLPDPIMTFDLHRDFINAAKCENPADRVTKVAALLDRLPPENKKVLAILARHLRKVEARNASNKMTIQNLGVCFGPTLMRDRQETVQSIMELKFSNIIVEILIEEYEAVFGDEGSGDQGRDAPPGNPQPGETKPHRAAQVKATSINRLPSQRLRSRPKAVYELTSMPNILEKNNTKSTFRRGQAFRSQNGRSPSPRHRKDMLRVSDATHPGEYYSSTDDDELGHISPLDLNLGFDGIAKPRPNDRGDQQNPHVNVPPAVPPPPIPAQRATRAVKTVEKQQEPATGNSSDATSSNTSDPGSTTAPDWRPKRAGSPSAKKRLSSRSSRVQRQPVYAKVNKNHNNNNNSNSNKKSGAPPKPRSLAVSSAIVMRSKKFLASVKEGGSPTVPVKYARKMLHSPSKSKTKSIHTTSPSSKSPTSNHDPTSSSATTPVVLRKHDKGKSPVPTRRPKSEFIPSAFQVEEDDLQVPHPFVPMATGKVSKEPGKTRNGGDAENKESGVRPRSSAVLTSRESVRRLSLRSNSSSDDESDSVEFLSSRDVTHDADAPVMTSRARTLYACQAERDGEMSFQAGQLITGVEESGEPGWLRGTLNGRNGLFPANYVKFE